MLNCPSCGESHPPGTEHCPSADSRPEIASEPLADSLLGAVFDGRYQLLERVGTGGMGAVYRAVQTNIGRDVAVKVLSVAGLENADALRRFENEAQVISQLRHPNTLKLIDFGRTADGRPYLVTEFLRGQPLNRLLGGVQHDPRWTLGIRRQVCDALAEAHEKGIVHRDLKPENIFVETINGVEIVRVLDFGIARLGQSTHTITGTVFGTPVYMSPEQAQGDAVDARSDLYSIGIIAYQCLVGRPPFSGEQALAILLKHLQEKPIPFRLAAPGIDVPVEIEELVMSLLAKLPGDRPNGALELRDRIDRLLHGARDPTPLAEPVRSSVPAHQTITMAEPGDVRSPSHLGLVGAALLVVALSIVGAVWWNSRSGDVALNVEALPPAPVPVVAAPPEAPEPKKTVVEPAKPPPPRERETQRPSKKVVRVTKTEPAKAPDPEKKADKKPEHKSDALPPGFVDY